MKKLRAIFYTLMFVFLWSMLTAVILLDWYYKAGVVSVTINPKFGEPFDFSHAQLTQDAYLEALSPPSNNQKEEIEILREEYEQRDARALSEKKQLPKFNLRVKSEDFFTFSSRNKKDLSSIWGIEIASFRLLNNADQFKKQLIRDGYHAFLAQDEKYYRLVVGPFPSLERASQERFKLVQQYGSDVVVVQLEL